MTGQTGNGCRQFKCLEQNARTRLFWLFGEAKLHPGETAWQIYVEQTATGSQEALARLYDESFRLVYSLLVRILGNAADAEEVCLDVYMQVWRTAHTFDAKRGGATAWLIMLARCRAVDRLRSSARRRKQELHDPGSNEIAQRRHSPGILPDQILLSNQLSELIVSALQKLNTKERAVIELAYFAGMSHTEIAKTLHQPLGTIKTYIRRALTKLRSDFDKYPQLAVSRKGRMPHDRLTTGIRDPLGAYALGGVIRAEQDDWDSLGLKGDGQAAFCGPGADSVTMLVRMQPGATYPGHRHGGVNNAS